MPKHISIHKPSAEELQARAIGKVRKAIKEAEEVGILFFFNDSSETLEALDVTACADFELVHRENTERIDQLADTGFDSVDVGEFYFGSETVCDLEPKPSDDYVMMIS